MTIIVKISKHIRKKWKINSKLVKIRKDFEKKYPIIVQYAPPK
jgi:hypothetical protein